MANYRAVIRHYPCALEYLKKARWVRRGDVLAYAPNLEAFAFSTDQFGFRHTRFHGRDISIVNAEEFSAIGLLLGSSHVFGFGVEGNELTLASQLSHRIGYPVFGISFPEADTRTLCAAVTRMMSDFKTRLRVVMLATGGDFTRFCYTGQCDPMFGPPVLPADKRTVATEPRVQPFTALVGFSAHWSDAIAGAARAAGIRFVMLEDLTWFEKPQPDQAEAECGLGTGHDEETKRRFSLHRQRVYAFGDARRDHAGRQGTEFIKFPPQGEVRFVDEFHYRADSVAEIADKIAKELTA